jgi:ABC-2 type transport system ATP-binding protein
VTTADQRSGGGAPALELIGLWKRFGEKIAVAGLGLTVPAGSFFGMVGPNGAGKTTSLSMATGLLRPDAGTVRVLGQDLWADPPAAKRLVGVLPDGVKLFDRLSGRELITYHGLLRGLDRPTVVDRAARLLAALGLEDAGDTLVVDYSAGMTKKIALACALVHGPRLLLLDEPFEAVDPVSAATIRAILREVVDGGGTVVMSSHVMELVERLCDHVAIVHAGRVVAAGPLDAVRAGSTLEQRFVQAVGAPTGTVDLSWLHS